MALKYAPDVLDRLIGWKSSDPVLYAQTERVLEGIKANPQVYGSPGSPLVERLASFSVAGRDDEYVITWETGNGDALIVSVSSITELKQRARLRQ